MPKSKFNEMVGTKISAVNNVQKVMILLGTLWSAFALGIPQADTFGFYFEDIPFCFLFWLTLGWPGQLVVFFFCPGSMGTRLKVAALSMVLAFALMFIWLGTDEVAFQAFHSAEDMESFQRDRWWPYSYITLVIDGDPEWGYGYWAI